MHSRLFLSIAIIIGLATSLLTIPEALGGYGGAATSTRSTAELAPAGVDRFEVSLGYNYIHLYKSGIEESHMHGLDLSAFVNLNSWLGLGGDFMANFGHRTERFFGSDLDFDGRRFVYVFGPRVTVWHNPRMRLFAEALAGGVHAELEASRGSFSQTLSEDGFAGAVGGGLDWRFTRHMSWRVIQADYLPTSLADEWQHNFRVSTGIVFTFGGE
jgi:hypothetical protein